MQTTEDGEYIPTKELKTSFRIPKKPQQSGATAGANQAATLAAALAAPPPPPPPPSPPAQNQVLENSYYNYYNNYLPKQAAIYAAQQQQQTAYPAATGPASATEHVQSLVLNILQKETEKPKTYANHILRDTIPDLFDETLPKELTGLFQPLYCKLCTAQLSSNVVAKLHYKSKNHEKKIRKFLCDYATRHGQPLHPRARNSQKNNEAGANGGPGGDPQNPEYFYCDVCDLPLTGKMHAESHYLGKNHRRAILGIKRPAGKGYYDSSGKWIREKRVADEIAARGDTFGTSFIPQTALSTGAVVSPGVAITPASSTPIIGPPPPKRKHMEEFGCQICNVVTTCTQQLESHLKGHKHQKKLKQLALSGGVLPNSVASSPAVIPVTMVVPNYPPPVSTDSYYVAPTVAVDYLHQPSPVLAQNSYNITTNNNSLSSTTSSTVTHSAVSALINPETVQLGDCSAYRTPSGQYYCPVCNNTQSSVIQFRQHLNSKSHLKKAAAQKKS